LNAEIEESLGFVRRALYKTVAKNDVLEDLDIYANSDENSPAYHDVLAVIYWPELNN